MINRPINLGPIEIGRVYLFPKKIKIKIGRYHNLLVEPNFLRMYTIFFVYIQFLTLLTVADLALWVPFRTSCI